MYMYLKPNKNLEKDFDITLIERMYIILLSYIDMISFRMCTNDGYTTATVVDIKAGQRLLTYALVLRWKNVNRSLNKECCTLGTSDSGKSWQVLKNDHIGGVKIWSIMWPFFDWWQ